MREVIKEGRDVNEAIELACTQLGVDRGQVNFEIIELPKTSFFGLFKKLARVRVTIDEPETPKKLDKPAPRPAASATKQPAPAPKPKQSALVPRQPAPAPTSSSTSGSGQPAPVARPAETVPRPATPTVLHSAAPVQNQAVSGASVNNTVPSAMPVTAAAPEDGRRSDENSRFIPMDETEGKSLIACQYVKSVLFEMGVDAKLTVSQTENGIIIRLAGDGLGVVIGRRGETLDSLQYLSGLVANRSEGDYLRVTIDTGNYREKRERTLQQLARKLSTSAMRSGRSTMLEPMNPYERRIIHSTVSEIEGVSSSSVGEEPNRRVVISPSNMKPRYPKKPGEPVVSGAPRKPNSSFTPRPSSPRPSAPRQGEPRPMRYNDNRPKGEVRERMPRPPMNQPGATTSTDIDREYAKQLEKQPSSRPEATPAQEVRERIVREKPKDEAGNLPLYGKIDL